MKNECVIKETLDAVVMQESQIERLVERCREAQASGIEKSSQNTGLTESVSEAVTFTYGQLGGTLNPFTIKLTWEGELAVPAYLQKPGEAPIEKITIVKKDGTEIALIEDFMPIKENLKWSSGGNTKDYRTDEEQAEDTYQFINLLNIHEVDYLLINGEKVTVE